MWYLYIFGDNVEDRMGKENYLLFYLSCGVLAALGRHLPLIPLQVFLHLVPAEQLPEF